MSYKDKYAIDFDNVLGNGSFGTVHLATHKESGSQMAAKRIISVVEEEAENVAKDLKKLLDLDHPNITRVFDIEQACKICLDVP